MCTVEQNGDGVSVQGQPILQLLCTNSIMGPSD